MAILGLPFLFLAALGLLAGWAWTRVPDAKSGEVVREFEPKNPLELREAFFFGALFLAMIVATHLVVTYLGSAGAYSLAVLMGVTDVDPFIMGMTTSAGKDTTLTVAAAAILVAAASNNVAKGVYAFSLADRKTGIQSLAMLLLLALAGLAPLLWMGL
jgi:uncharacterized membrane protein (DUF4010 family)